MKDYRLTKNTEQDLCEVARYTRKEWSLAILLKCRDGLKKTFIEDGDDLKLGESEFSHWNLLAIECRKALLITVAQMGNLKEPLPEAYI